MFTYGNPSRGDDALGPEFYALLEQKRIDGDIGVGDLELLTDFQLQVEHALDLQGRDEVIFVDASMDCPEPFSFQKLEPRPDNSVSTHSVHPQALLVVYEQVFHDLPPTAYLLSIRGYEFDLGKPLSEQAGQNLKAALRFVEERIEVR